MPVPWKRASARSIVPSPPSTTARSALQAASSSNTSSTFAACATASRRAIAGAMVVALACVTTATTLTDGSVDPSVEIGGEGGVVGMDEMEDELPVALRPRQARVYDAAGLCLRREQRRCHLPHDPALDCRVAHDTLRP